MQEIKTLSIPIKLKYYERRYGRIEILCFVSLMFTSTLNFDCWESPISPNNHQNLRILLARWDLSWCALILIQLFKWCRRRYNCSFYFPNFCCRKFYYTYSITFNSASSGYNDHLISLLLLHRFFISEWNSKLFQRWKTFGKLTNFMLLRILS